MFNPSRLSLARQRRGLTKTKLASLVGLTVRSISAYEAGDATPSEESISSLSDVLGFPESFFFCQSPELPEVEGVSFRALSSMTARQKHTAVSASALAFELGRWIEKRFNLPSLNLPDVRAISPEAAADAVRSYWGIGQRPIQNMIHLLEANGIRVFSLVQDCKEVDAYSVWNNETPYVFLNTFKSAERSRYDAAHELGHLILHRHGGPVGREAELEADRFASAFLMPAGSVIAKTPRSVTLAKLVTLKHVWRVSVMALIHRLLTTNMVSEWTYRTLCIDASKKGFRKSEPNSIPRETSQLLDKVFRATRDDGVTKDAIAKDLHIATKELNSLVFGLVLTKIAGGSRTPKQAKNSTKPELRKI